MTSKKLKIHLTIWGVLVIVVVVGTTAASLSTSDVIVPLNLKPGETINVPIFRLFPSMLEMSLEFNRSDWHQKRPELGEPGWQETFGRVVFTKPGEPVKLLIQCDSNQAFYEAWPPSIYDKKTICRDLHSFNPNCFQCKPLERKIPYLKLPSGKTVIGIKVVEVGKKIEGERVSLIIVPPLTFKLASGWWYGLLWWFHLWPYYLILLAIYGVIIFKLSRPNKRIQADAAEPRR